MDSPPEEINRSLASHREWDRMAATRQFQDRLMTKKVFIFPAFLAFIASNLVRTYGASKRSRWERTGQWEAGILRRRRGSESDGGIRC